MNGTTDEAASSLLQDKEFLNLFRSVEQLGKEDKKMIKIFLDVLVTKKNNHWLKINFLTKVLNPHLSKTL